MEYNSSNHRNRGAHAGEAFSLLATSASDREDLTADDSIPLCSDGVHCGSSHRAVLLVCITMQTSKSGLGSVGARQVLLSAFGLSSSICGNR